MKGIHLHTRAICGKKWGDMPFASISNMVSNLCALSNSPQSALTCVEFTTQIQQLFDNVTVPFLCMIAEEDVVVDNSKAKELMEKSPSKDKTLKSYAALHGLLCEPAPLLGIIEDDFVQWLLKRCP